MLPNLIIIGGMKCGTTSLHYYLNQHPEISMSQNKELDFFIESKNWRRGITWYQSQFTQKTKVIGEASPNYTCRYHFPEVPGRMYKLLPDAKLIYLVRHPIKRMVAHYLHNYSNGTENRSLEESLLDGRMNRYLDRSQYYHQLCGYLEYYNPNQILVIPSEKLQTETLNTLGNIFAFLEVNVNYYSWRYSLQRHKTSRKRRRTSLGNKIAQSVIGQGLTRLPPQIRWSLEEALYFPFSHSLQPPIVSDKLKLELKARLRGDVEQLRDYTGYGFNNWDI
jgi:hypothetical protein